MSAFEVAHIREQGIDLVIVVLNSSFNYKTSSEQQEIIDELQVCANSAGLAGVIVPVWDSGGGRMAFIAPQNWHPFFSSVTLEWVSANINRELSCG